MKEKKLKKIEEVIIKLEKSLLQNDIKSYSKTIYFVIPLLLEVLGERLSK